MVSNNESCTWTINNFPRRLKDKYAAFLKSNNTTIRDHLEYLILKTLREAGCDIPSFELNNLIKRITDKSKGIK